MATWSEARLGYVPHFEVTTVDRQRVRYHDIWQRRNLVLVLVTPQGREAGARYASQLEARRAEFEGGKTAVVVTADAVPELAAIVRGQLLQRPLPISCSPALAAEVAPRT